jgi:hypothetical protein
MPPAFSASRAGVTPEASGHGSSGTFENNMSFVRHIPSIIIYSIPLVLFACLLGSGLGEAILGNENIFLKLLAFALSVGFMVPTFLTCSLVQRNLKLYKGWKEIAGITALFLTSITVFVVIAYALKTTPADAFIGVLWIGMCMIQAVLYAGMVYITDQLT